MPPLHPSVTRTVHRFTPDPRRVIAKSYLPGEEILAHGASRAGLLMQRILAIPDAEVASLLERIVAGFDARHGGFLDLLEHHYALVAHHVPDAAARPSRERRLLIGAYFTHEYSIEGAALFNPSIVFAPDQTGVRAGEHRFIMSLRAVGEGHISSIELRSGVIDADSVIRFDPPGSKLVAGDRTSHDWYDKRPFRLKLAELGGENDLTARVLDRLGERFTRAELEAALAWLDESGLPQAISYETARIIRMLASSNYVTTFPRSSTIAERVLFPAGPHETRGMEDARFVRFTEPDGGVRYYATYTAFDGFEILPQLIDTADFVTFRISTLSGSAAQNKGMALFPRRIDGRYLMLSRKDRENLYLATSDDVRHWNESSELYRPSAPWELLQIGNCGSPLETEAGWLVITHGVGPLRQYAIGALLLDIADPWKVIGRLREPLLVAEGHEREGYVPNVVYSCGALINGGTLVLPYGFSDSGVGVALVGLPDLLQALTDAGC